MVLMAQLEKKVCVSYSKSLFYHLQEIPSKFFPVAQILIHLFAVDLVYTAISFISIYIQVDVLVLLKICINFLEFFHH